MVEAPNHTIQGVRFHEFAPTEFDAPNKPLLDVILSLEPGEMVLNQQRFAAFSPTRLTADFTEDPTLKEGRRGIHRPYFGYLGLRSRRDYRVETAIAVKPFRGEFIDEQGHPRNDCPRQNPPVDLTYEWAASEAISRLFKKDVTFMPAGLWRSEGGVVQLLTEFNRSVVTVDNVFYDKLAVNKGFKVTKDQIIRAIRLGLYEVGVLAGGGYAHMDSPARNIGRERKILIWYPDNEKLKKLQFSEENVIADSITNLRNVTSDVNIFMSSIVSRSYTSDETARKIFGVLDDETLMKSLVRSYNNAVNYGAKLAGNMVPDEFFMTTRSFMKRVAKETQKARDHFL